MTNPHDQDEAMPPDGHPPDPPSIAPQPAQSTTAASSSTAPMSVQPQADAVQPSTASPSTASPASSSGWWDRVSDKLVVPLLVAILGLFGANIVHTSNLIQGLRSDTSEEIRASEDRQIARVDALSDRVDTLGAELREEIRASEDRQIARVDALAAEFRMSAMMLSDRLSAVEVMIARALERLASVERKLIELEVRMARLETELGLPPLPPTQAADTSAGDA